MDPHGIPGALHPRHVFSADVAGGLTGHASHPGRLRHPAGHAGPSVSRPREMERSEFSRHI